MKRAKTVAVLSVLLVLTLAVNALAISIRANFGVGFIGDDADKQKIVNKAIEQWESWFYCGPTITIDFTRGPGTLGGASGLEEDNDKLPKKAKIRISTADIIMWDLKDPKDWGDEGKGKYDALTILKHEIGHAIGFAGHSTITTLNYSKFAAHIKESENTPHGHIWFFSFDQTDNFDPNVDIVLDPERDGNNDLILSHFHPTIYSNDLMLAGLLPEIRRHDQIHHAKMLGKAFGYCVVPEPGTLVLFGSGVAGLLMYRKAKRRKAAA